MLQRGMIVNYWEYISLKIMRHTMFEKFWWASLKIKPVVLCLAHQNLMGDRSFAQVTADELMDNSTPCLTCERW